MKQPCALGVYKVDLCDVKPRCEQQGWNTPLCVSLLMWCLISGICSRIQAHHVIRLTSEMSLPPPTHSDHLSFKAGQVTGETGWPETDALCNVNKHPKHGVICW